MQILLLSALAFVVTFAIVVAVANMMMRNPSDPVVRLEELAASGAADSTGTPGSPREDMMPHITGYLKSSGLTQRLYTELAAAGLPIRPSEFVGITLACGVVGVIVSTVVIRTLLGHVVLGLIGLLIPIIVLRHLQDKRRALFESQIVDALTMIASSLRSGFSILRAMQVVAQEMPPPISQEFQRVINEISVGRPMEDALKAVVARVKSYDFDLAVTAILIQLQVGGNLSEILDNIANTIRERVRILGEMRALTAEGRLSGVILVLLPIFLGIALWMLNPTYISVLFTESLGHILIGGAVVLQIIGALIIRNMLAMEV